jgi:hypothetical protein
MDYNDVRIRLARFLKREAPEDMDARVNLQQGRLFSRLYEAQMFEGLRPFKKVLGDGTPPLYVVNGSAKLPDDYFAKESGYIITDGGNYPLEFLEDNEFDDRRHNYIEIPDLEHPIGNLQPSTLRVLPQTVQYVLFSYFIAPPKVKYGYKRDRGFVEYDSTAAVQLLWNDEYITEIIIMVLETYGIQVTAEQVNKKEAQQ